METEGKKTRSFRNFRKKNKPDSNNAQAHGSPTMLGDAGTNDGSSGEPPPAPSKSKQRLKLWDSFLHKTKKIRVRHPKEKNEALDPQRRSTSQPNIPSSSRNRNSGTSDDFQQRNATPNGVDGSADRTTSRRAAYRRQGAKFTSRSSSSLDDSAIEATSPVGHKTKKPTKFNRDSTEDDGYRSAHDRSKSAYRTSGVPSDLDASSPDGETLASGSKEIDSFTEQAVDVGDMLALGKIAVDEDTVPITEQKVSKSVDSLLAVASSISLPPDAELRVNQRSDRQCLQPLGIASSLSVTATNGQVRRHSYDTSVRGKSEDSPEFYDCQEGVSDSSMTASSPEPSPVHHRFKTRDRDGLELKRKDSVESWEMARERQGQQRQWSLSSLDPSLNFQSDRDSPESDIDEKSSSIMDTESHVFILSDDNSSFAASPGYASSPGYPDPSSVTVHTSVGQEPPLIPVAQQLMQQHSAFVLNVNLREGKDLVIRDSCGTSDPYVKFKFGGKLVYKSRTIYKNLNPLWDEQFTIAVDDITKPVNIKVFDYDRAWNDDPMGGVDLDISALELNKETDLKLMLSEKGNAGYMGYLVMSCMLVPKAEEDKDQAKDKKTSFFRRTTTRSTESSSKKMKMQQWNGVVNIVLVEGMNLVSMDDNGLSDPYVKFRLGMEKYRSKFKPKTLNPKWLEQFDLRLFDDQSSLLEITVYDHDIRGKDDFMGRAVIDLSQLEREKTHDLSQELEDGAGTIKIMLTISGTFGGETASDLANYTPNAMDKDQLVSKYGTMKSLNNINDVGFLEVKVFRAQGLQAADFGGLSDPFCVLELVNDRVQTQTEYKTLNPEWSKVFTFHVKDIHTVLEVTIFDEDRNKKVEFLGRVEIPLLRIRNGERRWYALKDRKMLHKTKGAVLLEMDLVFNHLKAAIRTVNPRQEKFMVPEQKFKIATMKRNINRVTQLFSGFVETGKFIQSCFDWVSPLRTITAFIVYLVIVWNFELYMLPITLLLVFLKNLVVAQIVSNWKESVEDDYFEEDDDDDEDDKEKQEEKKSIVDRYHAVQEVCLQVQQGLDMVASLGEKVQNTFNWSVPWLSTLAVVALVAGSIVLYYIPIRYLLLAWGINKFTKKLRKPNAIPNNELLDFLSCVPSNNELLRYRELRPDVPANTPATKKKRS